MDFAGAGGSCLLLPLGPLKRVGNFVQRVGKRGYALRVAVSWASRIEDNSPFFAAFDYTNRHARKVETEFLASGFSFCSRF